MSQSNIPIVLLLALVLNNFTSSQTFVQGSVSGTWSKQNSPYRVIGDIWITDGQELTIEPGSTVEFGLGLNLTVGGHLTAHGLKADSITFTSTEESKNPGQWTQIKVVGSASFRFCTVEAAGYGTNYGIYQADVNARVTIDSSLFRDNSNGVLIQGDSSSVRNSVVEFNSYYGIALGGGVVDNCHLHSNGTGAAIFQIGTIEHSTISQNGVGIMQYGSGGVEQIIVRGCQIKGNSGYGISVSSGSAHIDSCLIDSNGVGVSSLGGLLRRCVIVNNKYGAVSSVWGAAKIINNTIWNNGAGILNAGSNDAIILNNIIGNNSGAGVQTTVSPGPAVRFNDFYDNSVSDFDGFSSFYGDTALGFRNENRTACDPFSNILIAPLFTDAQNQDFSLSPTSQLIDAGDTLSERDPDSTFADIGAISFDQRSLNIQEEVSFPIGFVLSQNYPNPFNPSTTIGYALSRRLHVTLTVFNTLGQQIATLVEGEKEAGYHEVQFDASAVSSGVYFYRLTAGSFVETKKLLFVR